jgi:putative ABC transport system permease protein
LLAGTLKNSIFQGNILIDKALFKSIWPEITGSEIALIKTSSKTEAEEVKMLIERALSEYGARVTPTMQRLKEFNSVTDTYLTIFLVLGGFGLLIGIAGFIIVVRKDLASRRQQIALMRSIGFNDKRLEQILTAENRLVPLAAIITGFALSLCAVIGGLKGVTSEVWIIALIFLLLLLAGALFFIKKEVKSSVTKSNPSI